MEIIEIGNGWKEIRYKKSDIFRFQHNGWECIIKPSYPDEFGNIWEVEIYPIGTTPDYDNPDYAHHDKLDEFDNAFTYALECCFYRPEDEPLFESYSDNEIDKLKIQILYRRIKNGHKKYGNKKNRPINIQRKWAKQIKDRDKVCVRCGSSERLEAHHIESYKVNPNNWDLSNGILLCKKCHIIEHSGKES